MNALEMSVTICYMKGKAKIVFLLGHHYCKDVEKH